MKHGLLTALALSTTCAMANTTTTVTQVTSAVTVDADVDYVITSDTPFTADGQINLSGNSTLILKSVIPSQALTLASHIRIDGAAASNKSNCMFKVYGGGTIILAHGTGIQPFVAYAEPNQEGESKSYSVGSRLSLAGTTMNNNIASFTLKRGYMVCLANQSDGKGYSRVYIADTEDRAVNLPLVLKDKVSSIRVMQWNDCGKRGYSGGDVATLDALNASWYYDWNCGGVATDDWEYVPQHHHEGWPGISDIGASSHSPHALGNNEPDNTGDAREQVNTVDEVLANWPAMMATGKRLGSPAVSGNYNWLYAFIDSIDARGWRCDFIAVHAYWYNDWPSWKSTLQNIANRTGRPIWITEMNYGANWTGWPGSDRSGSASNFAIEKQHFAPVIDGLEESDFMERYAVYNWVEDCRSMYLNGKLTPMGQYYADVETHVGYKASKEKVPTNPRMYNPSNLVATYDKEAHLVTLEWKERNGEYNRSMEVQVKTSASASWQTVETIECKETESDYTYSTTGRDGYTYRIHVFDLNNRERLSNEATAVNENIQPGDEVTVGDKTMFLGGNMLVNGSFEFGLADWTNGAGQPLAAPYFEVVSDGIGATGNYLQCYGGGTNAKDASALRKVMSLESGASYYVSASGCYGDPKSQRISSTSNPSLELYPRLSMPAVSMWAKQAAAFTVNTDTLLLIQMRNLGGKAMLGDFVVSRLFDSKEEALDDALACSRRRADFLSDDYLNALSSAATSYDAIETAIGQILQQRNLLQSSYGLMDKANTLVELRYPNSTQVSALLQLLENAETPELWLQTYSQLNDQVLSIWPDTRLADVIQNPMLTSTGGWNTIAGTYKDGDQRLATQAGKTCWNAWWNVPASQGETCTMAIDQTVLGLNHGYYSLECLATTQHLCTTDQHAFLQTVKGGETHYSPILRQGLLDLPLIDDADRWTTLSTPWVYVADGDTVTIGFEGSKQGAVDGSWIPFGNPSSGGDNRNGWWCATGFRLRYIPVCRRAADAACWGTLCLPNDITVPEGVSLYEVAGILSDQTAICLQPVTEVSAGVPCIFHVDGTGDGIFFEGSQTVSSPKTNVNGLRGIFSASSKYPVGSLVLTDGVWQYIPDTDHRYPIVSYSAFIQKVSNLPVLDTWSGVMLPTSGLATGLTTVTADLPDAAPSYNVAGQPAASAKGIVIQQGVIRFNK